MHYQWPAIIGELLHLSKPQIHPAFIVLTDINMKTEVQKLKEVVIEFSEKESVALEVTPILQDEYEKKPITCTITKIIKLFTKIAKGRVSIRPFFVYC